MIRVQNCDVAGGKSVRYRIEYLMLSADAGTVCQTADAEGNLEFAELQARLNGR